MSKKRIDILLTERELAPTMSKAQAMILAGEIFVKGERVNKAGDQVKEDAEIEIRRSIPDFVSRGGHKLSHALKEFKIDVTGKVCVDIGASTGGFTDCMLKNGAKKVYAIDVGYGQLYWSLRNDKRVINLEKVNIKNFDLSLLEEKIDIITIDVSFIGLEKVFPKVDEIARCHGEDDSSLRANRSNLQLITLIKPQFQVGRENVGKGGVVRDEALRMKAIESVKRAAAEYPWEYQGVTESPIKGPKGNIEYLALWLLKS